VQVEAPKLFAAGSDVNFDPVALVCNAAAAFCLNLSVFLLIGKTSGTPTLAGISLTFAGISAMFASILPFMVLGAEDWEAKQPVAHRFLDHLAGSFASLFPIT
jgi:hypothetical protein